MPDAATVPNSRFNVFIRGSAALLMLAGAGGAYAGNSSFTTIYSFQDGSTGEYPTAPVIVGDDGFIYGTTSGGGTLPTSIPGFYGDGTVFKLTPDGQLSTLYTFLPVPLYAAFDGGTPNTRLVQGNDGALYGATKLHYGAGCSTCTGIVFKVLDGVESILNDFNTSDFATYSAGQPTELVMGDDGYLYGATASGGAFHCGVIYRMTTEGVVDTTFGFIFGSSADTGCSPVAGLLKGSDGNFYGTTIFGGASGSGGTIFRISPQGQFTTLHQFAGNQPVGKLVQARNGALYGMTQYNNNGTIFRITPAGTFSTVYSFSGYLDGFLPMGDLVAGDDGALYGLTQKSGFFRLTSDSQLITLGHYGFSGNTPPSSLTPDGKGSFYVTTQSGGQYDNGTVSRFTPATPNMIATASISATSTTITLGSSTVISWASTNASQCQGESSGYIASGINWIPPNATSGSFTYNTAQYPYNTSTGTETFWVECSSASGTTSKSISINVIPKPPSVTLTVSPSTIALSDSATLSWGSINVSSCTASDAWSGSKATSGSQIVVPKKIGVGTFKLSCTGNDGSTVSSTAKLTVNAPPPPTLMFYAMTPAGGLRQTIDITLGQSVNLEWVASYASSCEGSGAWGGTLNATGEANVTPTAAGTYAYTLSCSGLLSGSTTGSVNVVVH